jgi:hypothetical protein
MALVQEIIVQQAYFVMLATVWAAASVIIALFRRLIW